MTPDPEPHTTSSSPARNERNDTPPQSSASAPMFPMYTDPAFYAESPLPDAALSKQRQDVAYSPSSVPLTPVYAINDERSSADHTRNIAASGGLISLLLALLLKFQTVLLLLLKAGPALLSVVISIGVYTLIFGWQFALGFVALLFLHEMGHALMMRARGIPMGGMIFVPLLGAAVTMQQRPHDVAEEAAVGIAGPIAGTLASLLCLAIESFFPDSRAFWTALAYTGLFMNLFNLIPVLPFDGGRVLAAIDRRLWFLGFGILLALEIYSWIARNPSPFLLLFLLLAGIQLWTHRRHTSNDESYYRIRSLQRLFYACLYFGVLLLIIFSMLAIHPLA